MSSIFPAEEHSRAHDMQLKSIFMYVFRQNKFWVLPITENVIDNFCESLTDDKTEDAEGIELHIRHWKDWQQSYLLFVNQEIKNSTWNVICKLIMSIGLTYLIMNV